MERELVVRLVRSMIGERRETRRTLFALGLRKVNDTAVHVDRPSARGMIARVRHLVKVEERQKEAVPPGEALLRRRSSRESAAGGKR